LWYFLGVETVSFGLSVFATTLLTNHYFIFKIERQDTGAAGRHIRRAVARARQHAKSDGQVEREWERGCVGGESAASLIMSGVVGLDSGAMSIYVFCECNAMNNDGFLRRT
jgi:hypothetical protein